MREVYQKTKDKAPTLIEYVDKVTMETLQVTESRGIYGVTYDGKFIGIRHSHLVSNRPDRYNQRTIFDKPGFAHNLADRLNTKFKTDKFKVMDVIKGVEHVKA